MRGVLEEIGFESTERTAKMESDDKIDEVARHPIPGLGCATCRYEVGLLIT